LGGRGAAQAQGWLNPGEDRARRDARPPGDAKSAGMTAYPRGRAPDVPPVLVRWHPGGGPVWVRGTLRNPLRQRHLRGVFALCRFTLRSLTFRVLANPVLPAGQGARLTQPAAALELCSRSDAGVPLFLGQILAVDAGGGAESATVLHLRQGVWVLGPDVGPPSLLPAPQIPDPIAAPPALEGAVKTARRGPPKRAVPAVYGLAFMLTSLHGVHPPAGKLCRF